MRQLIHSVFDAWFSSFSGMHFKNPAISGRVYIHTFAAIQHQIYVVTKLAMQVK